MNKDFYCVIMAGGAGTRFWPISRSHKPKQFLDILGIGKTLLQQTFERFEKICPSTNIFIVTGAEHSKMVKEQLPNIDESQILLENMRRNTAPCIAYANFRIQKINPNARIIVAPSDHLILNEEKFIEIIKSSLNFIADEEKLLTLGIEPTRPDTGYGYIQIEKNDELSENKNTIKKVKTFTEKPNLEMATFFVNSGEFFWNSGIFLWSLKAIQKAFKEFLPDIYTLFNEKANLFNTDKEQEMINEIYSVCTSISIDYGIMEKAKNVYVLGANFGWSDLGTWTSLFEHTKKDENDNSKQANIMFYDSKNTFAKSFNKKKIIVLQGLENYIVVDSEDALLICSKDKEQQIRLFVNDIKSIKGDKYI